MNEQEIKPKIDEQKERLIEVLNRLDKKLEDQHRPDALVYLALAIAFTSLTVTLSQFIYDFAYSGNVQRIVFGIFACVMAVTVMFLFYNDFKKNLT